MESFGKLYGILTTWLCCIVKVDFNELQMRRKLTFSTGIEMCGRIYLIFEIFLSIQVISTPHTLRNAPY